MSKNVCILRFDCCKCDIFFIRMITSRTMRWAGNVADMGEKRHVCRILVGKPEGKRPLGGQDLSGRIIFKWV
jgi:hypothetical protein